MGLGSRDHLVTTLVHSTDGVVNVDDLFPVGAVLFEKCRYFPKDPALKVALRFIVGDDVIPPPCKCAIINCFVCICASRA